MRTIYGPIYTLRPFERGIQEKLGRYSRFVMPGLGFKFPSSISSGSAISASTPWIFNPNPVITKDNVEILVDGIMWVRPTA
jgi:regulator of protease activity HflC (stomatin/prohibitin superfamily)